MKKKLNYLLILLLSLFLFACGEKKTEENVDNAEEVKKEIKTVKIGNQIWMAENFDAPADSGVYCYNYDENNCEKYGRLYTWDAAMKLCPEGWRLPTIEDYYVLIKHYGFFDSVGGKLKSTKYWEAPSVGNEDPNSFNALPAGFLNEEGGSFNGEKFTAKFWTSSEQPVDHAYYIELEFNNFVVKDDVHHKRYALSVRYIKK